MKTLAGYKLAETLGLTFAEVEQCSRIARLAVQHRKRMENVCNYAWANTETYEKATDRLKERIEQVVTALYEMGTQFPPGYIEFDGDPRGHTIKYVRSSDGREYGLD